jgi:c-di-GMP-binding flagellar brake protein YcgR
MTGPMPEISSPVSLTLGETELDSRVELVDGTTVVVTAPFNEAVEIPSIGSVMTLSWVEKPRGRYFADARLVSTSRIEGVPTRCWSLTIESTPVIIQRRQFVRAGGGEPVRVHAPQRDVVISGSASDISEGGVRFKIRGARPGDGGWVRLDDGEEISAVVHLGDEMLDADGSVLRTIEDPMARTVDMIVMLELNERQAETVRRYVMHQQILARRTAADADY